MINDSLLFKYLSGETSQQENTEILNWIELDEGNLRHFNSLKSLYEEDEKGDASEMEEDWMALQETISKSKKAGIKDKDPALKWIIRAAAAIIILIGTALIMNMLNNKNTIRGTSHEPMAYELPDGSQVLLKKGAKLTYSDNFNVDQREVSISGEAFFRVTRGSEFPFIVQTNGAKIKVTGTSFRVSAPVSKEDIEVVVSSGKVLFYNNETYSENSFKVDLGPGDKGIYYPSLNQLNKSHDKQYKNLNWN